MPDDPDHADDEGLALAPRGGDAPWEMPEIASTVLLAVVALLIVGSVVSGWLVARGGGGPMGTPWWSWVVIALRWLDPSITGLLLLAAAVVWWRYGAWVAPETWDADPVVADAHASRLRSIARWTLRVLVVTVGSSALQVVALVEEGSASGSASQGWGFAIEGMCFAVASGALAVLGLVALRPVVRASGADLEVAKP